MPSPTYSGWDARVKIGDYFYAARTISIVSTAADLDVSNTEGIPGGASHPSIVIAPNQVGFMAKALGLKSATIRITSATYISTNNLFAGNILTRIGERKSITVLHTTLNSPRYFLDYVLITELSVEIDVAGLQPITLSGVTDGYYEFGNNVIPVVV